MCTAINYHNNFFGRNLDLEYPIDFSSIAITPRNYLFKRISNNNETFSVKNAIIGMAFVLEEYPLYFEAMNEKGVFIAGLDFRGYAHYFDSMDESKINVASFEFVPYLLAQYDSVDEIKKVLGNIRIINNQFNKDLRTSPLHWFISDSKQAIVVEPTKDGLKVYDNPYGVLTNCPDFSYHLENMRNYIHLSPIAAQNTMDKNIQMKPISNGSGTEGLPGGLGSVSRFVRVAYTKLTSKSQTDDELSHVTQFFHILDSVKQVKGQVIGLEDQNEITIYSSCISSNTLTYYYKTYTNNQINAVSMNNVDLNAKNLYVYQLNKKQNINYQQ
ncbi:choloylglycine hydrolase [Mycoplasmoides pirum]|uniref:choloylglycine hydrolase n=1 Tax=Mycoplasmoides pirum TaxID=2122 RepID=UPI000482A275|nr:choloylglycine hydrolase [Mycoplasmoides pirum]